MTWLFAIGRFLKRVPWQVWALLGAAFIIWRVVDWHFDTVREARDAGYAQGEADTDARWAARAVEWKGRIDGLTIAIAREFREQNDEKSRAIASAYDALRLSGPGKAACPGYSIAAAGAGGRDAADRPGDAAVAGVPAPERIDLIALPFAGTVGFGESHDLLRQEVIDWRAWHARLVAEWAKWEAEARAEARGD